MAPHPDSYSTVHSGPEIETKVKGSRFLGQVFAAATESEAAAHLSAIRKKYYDATHHCSAWRVGSPDEHVERFDDDGEPSRTAGAPILGAIHREDVFNAMVVVTRYYGGTKLGTGGLARAYGDAARAALAATKRELRWLEHTVVVTCAFDDLGVVETLLGRRAGSLLDVSRSFDPDPLFVIRVPRSDSTPLKAELVEATAGRAEVEIND